MRMRPNSWHCDSTIRCCRKWMRLPKRLPIWKPEFAWRESSAKLDTNGFKTKFEASSAHATPMRLLALKVGRAFPDTAAKTAAQKCSFSSCWIAIRNWSKRLLNPSKPQSTERNLSLHDSAKTDRNSVTRKLRMGSRCSIASMLRKIFTISVWNE